MGARTGQGLARRIQRRLEEAGRAARYRTLSLVAVLGAQTVWAALGYRARPEIGLPASYGAEALYMAKPLEPPASRPAVGASPGAASCWAP